MSVKQAVRNYHDEFEAERKRVVDNSRAALQLRLLAHGIKKDSREWKIAMESFEIGVDSGSRSTQGWYEAYGCYP